MQDAIHMQKVEVTSFKLTNHEWIKVIADDTDYFRKGTHGILWATCRQCMYYQLVVWFRGFHFLYLWRRRTIQCRKMSAVAQVSTEIFEVCVTINHYGFYGAISKSNNCVDKNHLIHKTICLFKVKSNQCYNSRNLVSCAACPYCNSGKNADIQRHTPKKRNKMVITDSIDRIWLLS